MIDDQKHQAIREFFTAPEPFLHVKAIATGTIIAFIGLLIAVNSSVVFGLLTLVAGALWAVFLPLGVKAKPGEEKEQSQYFSIARYGSAKVRYEARPTYQQMLDWLREDLQGIAKRSEERLGLEETTRDPVFVIGPLYSESVDGFSSADVLRRKTGADYFYSTYRLSIFHFSDKFLGAYQANYNMIKGVTSHEETDEFFYKDVVSVKTLTEATSYTLKSGEKLEHSKMFCLAVSSGDRISVVINDPKIKATTEIESIGDGAIANIRAMLRQYKVA
ncbi:MAG TPA: hypothetical protein VHC97_13540 [Thermoanaerobaculia bacterium]|jgi:hypothetical protein|nr:hypothetical protein [Thermoanaerobaculia bacterium]